MDAVETIGSGAGFFMAFVAFVKIMCCAQYK
jgi:hypothetical protein